MPSLQQAGLIEIIPQFIQFLYQLMGIFADFLVFVKGGKTGAHHRLDDKHGMVRRERTPGFCNDVRLGQVVFLTDIHNRRHSIVHVFLDGIVHAIGRCRTGTIVIHPQAAANIHKMDVVTQFLQLHIKLRHFFQCRFDTTDVGDLAAYMEMNELQAFRKFRFLQQLQSLQ